ncbi:hypothetical protein IU427_15425 [Nocardia beijingensis]|uniref:hypothetical protein n=1 Tax=Nocardia beijingensis TaxID=95162 RepID=UPI00189433B4|nr:hypothetical protein [Nocardia beijingensis]MBF6466561.1 hypothetical protein [Nocardia beijingensis]
MADHRRLRAAGPPRLVGLLTLLLGVVAMHSVVFGASEHAHIAGAQVATKFASAAAPDSPGRTAAPRHVTGHEATSSHHATSPRPDSAASGHDRLRSQDPARVADGDSLRAAHTPVIAPDDFFAARGIVDTAAHAEVGRALAVTASRTGTPRAHAAPASWTGTPRAHAAPASHSATAPALVTTKLAHCAGGGGGGGHGTQHGCVFILVALLALAALVLLYRMAVDRPGAGAARPRHWRARRERPPPWTVLTLAELAILRI